MRTGLAVGVELVGVDVFVEFVDLNLVHGDEERVGGIGVLAVGDLADGEAVGEEVEGLFGLKVEGGVFVEALVEDRVGDGGGVELLLEPFVRGDGEDLFDVAGAWAEGEAVEELLGSFLRVEGNERGGFCGGGRFGFWVFFSGRAGMMRWRAG